MAQATSESPATSFGPVRQVEAGVLSVGYVEARPPDGPAVVLLHGWPYDVHSFAEVTPMLAAAGFRVLVPYLRGYGSTRLLSDDAARNGQQTVLAQDTIALMDALGIERAAVGGFDWGARSADIIAALWPERCTGLVSVRLRAPMPTSSPVRTRTGPSRAASVTTSRRKLPGRLPTL